MKQKDGLAVSCSIFDDEKGNTESEYAKSTFFRLKKKTLRKTCQKCFNKFIHGKAIVEWCGKMRQKDGLALIALYLVKINWRKKMSSSKHAKKINFGHETGRESFNRQNKLIFR